MILQPVPAVTPDHPVIRTSVIPPRVVALVPPVASGRASSSTAASTVLPVIARLRAGSTLQRPAPAAVPAVAAVRAGRSLRAPASAPFPPGVVVLAAVIRLQVVYPALLEAAVMLSVTGVAQATVSPRVIRVWVTVNAAVVLGIIAGYVVITAIPARGRWALEDSHLARPLYSLLGAMNKITLYTFSTLLPKRPHLKADMYLTI